MKKVIIPAVFAFSGGDAATLQAGPSLMFITIPKVFASMGFGTLTGVMFFVLVLFAALTSSIALTESAVSTFEDEFKWSRKKSTTIIGLIIVFQHRSNIDRLIKGTERKFGQKESVQQPAG